MITRFAPSPTGPLHLGHAYSAIIAHDMARAAGGAFLLRIEDIDHTRCRAQWEDAIFEDLDWLGISWDAPPIRQSDRAPAYAQTLKSLWEHRPSLLYACTCSRRDIMAALSAPQEGGQSAEPAFGPDGPIYPGTCRASGHEAQVLPPNTALRLNMGHALSTIGDAAISFDETGVSSGIFSHKYNDLLHSVGDIVLSRKDFIGSYHLAVTLDDAAQGVSHVVRGQDLFEATKIHVLLQRLLGLPKITYHHHRLIRDRAGKRLAKRDDARAIAKYRKEGVTPDQIRAMLDLPPAT